jgi:hypothetical protein
MSFAYKHYCCVMCVARSMAAYRLLTAQDCSGGAKTEGKMGMSKTLAAIAFLSVMAVGSTAWALVAQPVDVPEPGIFGIVAAGAAAVILATRLRRNK